MHGGNRAKLAKRAGCNPNDILDFSISVNPLGPPDWLNECIESALQNITHYPDPYSEFAADAVSKAYDVLPDEVILGNGATELLNIILGLPIFQRAVIVKPAYSDYAASAVRANLPIHFFTTDSEKMFDLDIERLSSMIKPRDLVIFGHPANPTGMLLPSSVDGICSVHPDSYFLIDESFLDLSENGVSFLSSNLQNKMILKSFTKAFAVPGLRIGAVFANQEIIKKIKAQQPHWSVNTFAQHFITRAVQDENYLLHSKARITFLRKHLIQQLSSVPHHTVYPSVTNFVLAHIYDCVKTTTELEEELLVNEKIAIRDASDMVDNYHYRIAVCDVPMQTRLIDALLKYMS